MGARHMSDETRAELLAAYASDRFTIPEIARMFGVSPVTVTRYAKRAGIGQKSAKSESPGVLDDRSGAWIYGSDGIARWHDGARPQQFDDEEEAAS